ncbi:MAG: epoxyqueuosine reductase [Firmicutes bacterium]|nr:epoxyqueuosine reductase [Bacillota bacterium]
MERSSLTMQVKEFAGSLGAGLVGVADANRVAEVEPVPERRPEFFLPGARCVVVIGLKMVDAIMDRLRGLKDQYDETLIGYLRHYNYATLDLIACRTARFLEDQGWDAYPIQARMTDKDEYSAVFSHKPAAVVAGLGVRGKHGLVVTPEFGPRVRFVSVITDAPLECAGPGVEKPSSVCGSCHVCIDLCPGKAIEEPGPDGTPRHDRDRCLAIYKQYRCALCQGACPKGKAAAAARRRRKGAPAV